MNKYLFFLLFFLYSCSKSYTIQNYEGYNISQIEPLLKEKGFNVRVIKEKSNESEEGIIISQDPSQNSSLKKSDVITFTVSEAVKESSNIESDIKYSIDSFNGFKWGSSKADIKEVAGDPIGDNPDFYMYLFEDNYPSIGGYSIDSITYFFRQECCLWSGNYGLKEKELDGEFDELTNSLAKKYGDYTEVKETNDYEGIQEISQRKWTATDGSSITLNMSFMKEDKEKIPRKYNLYIHYASSEYNNIKDKINNNNNNDSF